MRNDEIDSVHIRNDMVFLILSETGKRRKTSKRPCFTKCDTDGEVLFATASILTPERQRRSEGDIFVVLRSDGRA